MSLDAFPTTASPSAVNLADAPPPALTQEQAIVLIEEALSRLKRPQPNANGGAIQLGGVYWRLVKALTEFVDQYLDMVEGQSHADFIRANHGHYVLPVYIDSSQPLEGIDAKARAIGHYAAQYVVSPSLVLSKIDELNGQRYLDAAMAHFLGHFIALTPVARRAAQAEKLAIGAASIADEINRRHTSSH